MGKTRSARVLILVLTACAFTRANTGRQAPVDAEGRPVVDGAGARLVYGPEPAEGGTMRRPRMSCRGPVGPIVSPLPAVNPGLLREDATIGTFTQDLGVAGIVARDVDGDGLPEIFVGHMDMFYQVKWEPEVAGYTQTYYHDAGGGGYWGDVDQIAGIRVGPLGGGSDKVVALSEDNISFYDASSGVLLGSFAHGLSVMSYDLSLAIGDVDPAPGAEILVGVDGLDTVYVYRYLQPTPLWSVPATSPSALVVGQMDGDASLEIAIACGAGNPSPVFDAASRTVQWNYAFGFGSVLDAGDIDNDGKEEIVSAEFWGDCMAFDVDTQQMKWSFANFNTSAVRAADVTGDGVKEAIFGDAQWGDVHYHDGVTGAKVGSVAQIRR